ncbi:hypothetical protein GCM10023205_76460 [Yinghuangia aomiensis]|uniref:Uncharacterized protein n=1 Tax=Yinghuangia aomiensis TaxID=676205 RepID=A0ABP9I9K4_9ACTN
MSRPTAGLPSEVWRLAAWCVVAALPVVCPRAVTAPLAVALLGSALLYPFHQRLVRACGCAP